MAHLHRRRVAHLGLPLLLTGSLAAQIPEGAVVVASTSSLSGLSVLAPRGGSPAVPLQNVPAELVLTLGVSRGANAVTIHPDGRVLAGNLGINNGSPIAVHALTLSGLTISADSRVQVGTSSGTNGAVTALAMLPDGRCLVTANGLLPGGAMSRVAIVDVDSGAITPLSITGMPATIHNAVAVDAAGTWAWIGTFASTTSGQVYRVPLPNGGPATLIASFAYGISGLDVLPDGNLAVALLNTGTSPSLGVLDPDTGTFLPIPGTSANSSAVACERGSGDLMVLAITNSTQEVRHVHNGVFTMLHDFGVGTVAGVDVQDSPRRYGQGTALANSYQWRLTPSDHGVPFLGNAAFALESTASPGAPLLTLALVGLARAAIPALGVQFLVDPSGLITLPVPAATSALVPIPIPADPTLAGVVLQAQTLHLEAGGFATSDGVTFGPVVP